MPNTLKIAFAGLDEAFAPALVLFAGKEGAVGADVAKRLGKTVAARLKAAATAESFTGKSGSTLALPAESGLGDKPVHVLVVGAEKGDTPVDFLKLGGQVQARLPKGRDVSVLASLPEGAFATADFALGMKLAAYRFDRYQTVKKGDDAEPKPATVTLLVANPAAARKEMKTAEAVYAGVEIARDLVNEPPNVLTPSEFALRAAGLEKLGVEIEVLDEKAMKKLGMRALLGVGQGSAEESKLVIMKWLGAKDEKAQPMAFVGKGVVFDTGGLNLKPDNSMLLMRKDMGGAAAALTAADILMTLGAKINLRVIVAIVENSVAGNSFRPGDIYPSRKGISVEIGNTDAEGRLILADALALADEDKPDLLFDFATLTGAARVALGPDLPPFFTDDEALAGEIAATGRAVNDPVWRLPLWKPYQSMLDSKYADMNNVGAGGFAGSITAALFLKRFVTETKGHAHFDIYGWVPSAKPGRPEGGEPQAARLAAALVMARTGAK